MPFDPDAYAAQLQNPQSDAGGVATLPPVRTGFDPDAYAASLPAEEPEKIPTVDIRQAIRGEELFNVSTEKNIPPSLPQDGGLSYAIGHLGKATGLGMKDGVIVSLPEKERFYSPIEGASDTENELRRKTIKNFNELRSSNNLGKGVTKEELSLITKIAGGQPIAAMSNDDMDKVESLFSTYSVVAKKELNDALYRERQVRRFKRTMENQSGWERSKLGAGTSVTDLGWLVAQTGELVGLLPEGTADGVGVVEEAANRMIAEQDDISLLNAAGVTSKVFAAIRFFSEIALLGKISPSKLPALLKSAPPLVQKLGGGMLATGELFAKHAAISSALHGRGPEDILKSAGKGFVTGAAYSLIGAVPGKYKLISIPASMGAIWEITRLEGGSKSDQLYAVLQFGTFQALGLWRSARMKYGIGAAGKKYQRIKTEAQAIIDKNPVYFKEYGITAKGIADTVVAYDGAVRRGVAKEFRTGQKAALDQLGLEKGATRPQIAKAWYEAVQDAYAKGDAAAVAKVNAAGNLLHMGGKLPAGDPAVEPHVQQAIIRRAAALHVRAQKKAAKQAAKKARVEKSLPPVELTPAKTPEQIAAEMKAMNDAERNKQWERLGEQALAQKESLQRGEKLTHDVPKPVIPKVKGGASNKAKATGHQLARDAGLLGKNGKPTAEYRTLAESVAGVRSMADMTQAQADAFNAALKAHKKGTPVLSVASGKKSPDAKTVLASAKKANTNVSRLTHPEARVLAKSAGRFVGELSDAIDEGLAPPTDVQARAVWNRNWNEIGRVIKKAGDADAGYRSGGRRTKDHINIVRSSRDALRALTEATGQQFELPVRDIIDINANSEATVVDRMNAVMKEATGHGLRRLALFPMNETGMVDYLFESNDVNRKARFKALSPVAQKVVRKLEGILANESAWDTRRVKFQSWYDSFLASGSATEGKPPDVKKADAAGILLKGAKALKAGNLEAWIKTQSWGTRDLYYMSRRDPGEIFRDMFGNVQDAPGLRSPETVRPIKDYTPGAAKTRKGEGAPKKSVSVVNAIMTHWAAMKTAADTWEIRKGITRSAQKARISINDAKHLEAFVHSAMGGRREATTMTKIGGKISNAWWMGHLTSKGLWFGTRNLLQNVGLGPSQLNVVEYGSAVMRMADPKNRAPGMDTFFKNYLRTHMSQTEAMHQMYLSAGGPEGSAVTLGSKARNAKNFAWQIADYAARGVMYTDQINRVAASYPAYQMAYDAIAKFRKGTISYKALSRKLLLDMLPASQHLELQRTMDSGNMQQFAAEYARIKVDNIHMRYETASRSAIEQTRGNRLFLGPLTYFRGAWEIVYRDGIETVRRGIQNKSPRQTYQGARSLMATVAGTTVAKAVLFAATGKVGYDLMKMLSGHTALAPGVARMVELTDNVKWTLDKYSDSDLLDPASHLKMVADLIEIGVNTGVAFVPFAEGAIRLYEKENDVERARAFKIALKEVTEALGKKSGIKFQKHSRDTMEGFQHFFFGEQRQKKKKRSGSKDGLEMKDLQMKDLELKDLGDVFGDL